MDCLAADVRSAGDLHRVFSANVGFYRPLVALSFAIDRGIWNLAPGATPAQRRPGVREIVLLDDPDAAVTLHEAFGTPAPDAVSLYVSPDMHVSTGNIGTVVDAANADLKVFRLRAGRLVQDRVRTNGSPADTSASHPD
jgi:hypothetical protein